MDLGELKPGTVFARDYQIVRPLSSGGMGAVYVAKQLSTSKDRALKLMRRELVSSPEQRRRFEQEAKVGAEIDSDHVVEVVGAGIDDATQLPWLAMELLQGQDLAEVSERKGPLAPAAVAMIFEQLCHALGRAHEKRIVHRDLKPENVFLSVSKRAGVAFTVKVLDFGIAKTLAEAQTKMTAAIGTPLWMAPEQTQAGQSVSPATDVWALGLIAFRLLAGRSYWKIATDPDASTMMILREVLMDPLAPASDRARALGGPQLPAGFDAWFATCVAREPTSRFADAGTAHGELARILGSATASGALVLDVSSGRSGGASTIASAPLTADPLTAQPFAEPLTATPHAAESIAAPVAGRGETQIAPQPWERTGPNRTLAADAPTPPSAPPSASRNASPDAPIAALTERAPGTPAWAWGVLVIGLAALGAGAFHITQTRAAQTESAKARAHDGDPLASANGPPVVSPTSFMREDARAATPNDVAEPAPTNDASPTNPQPNVQKGLPSEPGKAQPANAGVPFDRGAAAAAMSAASSRARACKTAGGPTGSANVKVTFAPDGRATSTTVSGPLAGTSVGGCVASAFKSATVPPFAGAPVSVSKSVTIE